MNLGAGLRANFGKVISSQPKNEDGIGDGDNDGVKNADDKCPDVAGTKENSGCPTYDAKVTSIPESLKAGDKLPLGLALGAKSEVRIKFTDANNKSANTRTETIDSGDSTT